MRKGRRNKAFSFLLTYLVGATVGRRLGWVGDLLGMRVGLAEEGRIEGRAVGLVVGESVGIKEGEELGCAEGV